MKKEFRDVLYKYTNLPEILLLAKKVTQDHKKERKGDREKHLLSDGYNKKEEKTMGSRIMIVVLLLGLLLSAAPEALTASHNLRLATVVSPPHPWIDMAEFFAQEVEDRTNGEVTVRIYHSRSLGDDETTIDEMRIGTIDFVIGGVANAVAFLPEYQITGFSYLFEDMDHFRSVIHPENDFFQTLDTLHEERNIPLKLLALAGGGTRVTSSNIGGFVNPNDLAGVRMRLPANPLEVKIWEAFGAIPTTLPWGEIYSAVQSGLVSAFESTISGFYGSKLFEVAPHQSLTNHQIMISHFTMSRRTYDRLPENYQKIIEEVAMEAGVLGTDKGEEYDQRLLQEMKDNFGLKVYEVDIDAYAEIVMPMHDELAADIGLTHLLETIRDLR